MYDHEASEPPPEPPGIGAITCRVQISMTVELPESVREELIYRHLPQDSWTWTADTVSDALGETRLAEEAITEWLKDSDDAIEIHAIEVDNIRADVR